MRKTYIYEIFHNGRYEKEKKVLTSSLDHWLRNAKIEEKENCVVNINFKYSTKSEIVMTQYDSFNIVDGYHIRLTLQSEYKK